MPLPTPNPSEAQEAFIGRSQWRDEKVMSAMLALDELGGLL